MFKSSLVFFTIAFVVLSSSSFGGLKSVKAQTCENATIYAQVVPLCAKYLLSRDHNRGYIYLPAGAKFAVSSMLSNAGFEASRSLSFLPNKCKAAMYPFVCHSVFTPCDLQKSKLTGKPVAIQQPICYDACNRVIEACTGVVNASTLPVCNQFNNATQQPKFPEHDSIVVVGNESFKVSCVGSNENYSAPGFPFECPYPMVNFDKGDYPDAEDWPFSWPCGLRCPSYINSETYSDYKYYWHTRNVVDRIGAFLQFIFGIPLVVIMLVGHKHWLQWPICLLFIIIVVNLITGLAHLLPSLGPFVWVGCENDYTHYDTYHAGCLITGASTCLIMVTLLTWLSVLFNTLANLVLRNRVSHKKIFLLRYPILALLLGTAIAFVAWGIAANEYSGDINCFITSTTALWVVFWLWMGILILGFIFFFFIVSILFYREGMGGLKQQPRLLVFTLWFGSIYVVSNAKGVSTLQKIDAVSNDVNQFLTCVISNFVASVNPSTRRNQVPCHLEAPTSSEANMDFYVYFTNILIIGAFILLYWEELKKSAKSITSSRSKSSNSKSSNKISSSQL